MLSLSLPRPKQAAQVAPAFNAAQAACNAGQHAAAIAGLLEILTELPGHLRALRLLYRLYRNEGRLPAAEALIRRAVTLAPGDDWAACELSLLLYERREFVEAEQHARNGVRLNPDNPQAHNMLGMILTDTHRLQAGEFHYRKAIALHGPVGKLCANFGLNLKEQGKLEEAEAWYRQALELEPDNIDSRLGWVKLREVGRDLPGAWKLLEQLKDPASRRIAVALARSTLYTREHENEAALGALQAVAAEAQDSATYHFELGEIYDKLQRYDEAFAAFTRANELVRKAPNRTYDKARSDQLAQRLRNFFVRSRVEKLPRGVPGPYNPATPIFIVGFPRSGTTLVEQMLTAHPLVNAGDELPFVWDLTRVAPKILNSDLFYPECLADLWFGDNQAALENLRDFYLKSVRSREIITPGVPYFTDKMPLNETHLGLIHLVFPEAPVIHLIRHPYDVVLSCLFNDLTHGNNCAYSLDTAAYHYALTRGLLDHYLREMDIRYLPVRYEDVAANPARHCRRILDFVGLEWDERCLAVNENRRYARTASYAQVMEPIYMRSVHRYRHYLSHLHPIAPILEPVIERLGYPVD